MMRECCSQVAQANDLSSNILFSISTHPDVDFLVIVNPNSGLVPSSLSVKGNLHFKTALGLQETRVSFKTTSLSSQLALSTYHITSTKISS